MMAIGIGIFGYAAAYYEIGTLRLVGPGAFPIGVGILLAAVGVIVTLASLARRQAGTQERPQIKWADIARVGFSISAFALLISSCGAIPAVAAVVFICVAECDRSSWRRALFTTVVLSPLSILIFHYFLGLRFALIKWPF